MVAQLIPHIWADVIKVSLEKHAVIGGQLWKEEQAQHKQRMATDPDYARAYELRRAEDEAMSYWDALYDNQRPEDYEEEDDEW